MEDEFAFNFIAAKIYGAAQRGVAVPDVDNAIETDRLRGMRFGSRRVNYSVREHHGFADFSLAGGVFLLPGDFSATNYEHPMFLLFAGVKEIVAFR